MNENNFKCPNCGREDHEITELVSQLDAIFLGKNMNNVINLLGGYIAVFCSKEVIPLEPVIKSIKKIYKHMNKNRGAIVDTEKNTI